MNRRNRMRIRWMAAASLASLTGLFGMVLPSAQAMDCNPQSLAGRAAAGGIVNGVIGRLNQIAGGVAGVQNFISPTPSSALTDCVIPRLNPPPASSQPPIGGPISSFPQPPAQSWGDPHLVTLDGLAYDFQGAGDYVYVVSSVLTVQGRHVRSTSGRNVARLSGIALTFNGVTVVVGDPLDPSFGNTEVGLVTVDGVDLPINQGGWIDLDDQGSYVQRFARNTYIRLAGAARILINNNNSQMQLSLDDALAGQVSGLLGNFDGDVANDLMTGDGSTFTVDDIDTLYGAFLGTWQRDGDASLFNTPFDQMVGGVVVPDEVSSLTGVTAAQRDVAAQRCLDGGVKEGFTLYACTFDLVFDDDELWVESAATVSDGNINPVPAAALVNPVDGTTPLALDAVVRPGIPNDTTGVLANSFEVDRYSISVPAGASRLLQVDDPCSTSSAASVLLQRDGDKGQELNLTCNSAYSLPSGNLVLSVYSNAGDSSQYAFSLVEAAQTDLGIIALDTDLSGPIALNEQLLATLPSQTGDSVFLASNVRDSCALQWRLFDASNEPIAQAQQCTDLGLVTIGDNTPYRLEFEPGESSRYAFRVISVGADTSENIGDTLGQRIELRIDTPGQQASIEFSVPAGRRFYVDREGGVASGRLVVRDASGQEIARTAANNEDLPFQSLTAGTHTVTLEPAGDFTGTVPVTVLSVADDTRIAVVRGQRFDLTLTTPGQRAVATFDASVGETFTITQTGSGILARIQSPGDDQGVLIFGSRTFSADVAGVHEIAIGPSEGFVGTIGFELQ